MNPQNFKEQHVPDKILKTGIVVPSYNQGEFLEKALVSILDNAKHCPIKLIVMDGGSSDNTLAILQKYNSQIDFWQSRPDGGQASAINSGMQYLDDCEYVTWLNSDDEYENEWSVYTAVCAMECSGAKVVFGRSNLIDENGMVIGTYPVCPETDLQRLSIDCSLSQPSVFVRKCAWNKVGGLNADLQMCLDYDLWIRLAKEYTFCFVDSVIGNTRIYNQTKTSMRQDRHLLEGVYILQKHYGNVPYAWIHESYVMKKFGGKKMSLLQKIRKNFELGLCYDKVKTAYIKEAERVMDR